MKASGVGSLICAVSLTAMLSFAFGYKWCEASVYRGFFNQTAAVMEKVK